MMSVYVPRIQFVSDTTDVQINVTEKNTTTMIILMDFCTTEGAFL